MQDVQVSAVYGDLTVNRAYNAVGRGLPITHSISNGDDFIPHPHTVGIPEYRQMKFFSFQVSKRSGQHRQIGIRIAAHHFRLDLLFVVHGNGDMACTRYHVIIGGNENMRFVFGENNPRPRTFPVEVRPSKGETKSGCPRYRDINAHHRPRDRFHHTRHIASTYFQGNHVGLVVGECKGNGWVVI
jgi:hypothetical protein